MAQKNPRFVLVACVLTVLSLIRVSKGDTQPTVVSAHVSQTLLEYAFDLKDATVRVTGEYELQPGPFGGTLYTPISDIYIHVEWRSGVMPSREFTVTTRGEVFVQAGRFISLYFTEKVISELQVSEEEVDVAVNQTEDTWPKAGHAMSKSGKCWGTTSATLNPPGEKQECDKPNEEEDCTLTFTNTATGNSCTYTWDCNELGEWDLWDQWEPANQWKVRGWHTKTGTCP